MRQFTLNDPRWFLVFFVTMWLSISGLLSLIGGWSQLAAQFPLRSSPVEGLRFRFASAAIGNNWLPVSYSSCLFLTVAPSGLKLSVLPLFRFMHPPMLIPWSAVTSAEQRRRWFTTVTALRLRGFSRILFLAGRAGAAVLEAYESHRSGATA